MPKPFIAGHVRQCSFVAFTALSLLGANARAQAPSNADALLAIDQQRASVVERIIAVWGQALAESSDYVTIDELRARFMALRADKLFAASLAGTEDGLREVTGLATKPSLATGAHNKALGDAAADVVYTPVTPCRLVETRGTFAAVYQGNGTASHTPLPFASNEIRTYTMQGANGICLTQLPAGLTPTAAQLQVFGIPTTAASGDIEILPQGATFGSTATMVYVASLNFNTVSTAAKINTANKQISVQVRGGGAHLAIDVVGYFAAPSGTGGKFFRQGGNVFGTTATLGTIDNQPVAVQINNLPVLRLAASDAETVNVINGSPLNSVDPNVVGVTIAGGGGTFKGSPTPNRITADHGTIGGGSGNTAAFMGAIGGGQNNAAQGDWNVLGGGLFNVTSNQFSTVSGGENNSATNSGSVVSGGESNTADGFLSTVVGGSNNTASGELSLAAGHRAKATTHGSFIWADSREFDFGPSVDNFFGVRATGGVGFTVAINSGGGVSQFCNLLPGNPSWQCTSDRNSKENFTDIDREDVLARVVAMPISTWNFKGGDPALRSMGPTAQDFYAAFHLGNDDKSIATSNLASVALAAIQGLHQLVHDKDAKIEAQQREIDELRQRMSEVGTLRGELDAVKRTLSQFSPPHSGL